MTRTGVVAATWAEVSVGLALMVLVGLLVLLVVWQLFAVARDRMRYDHEQRLAGVQEDDEAWRDDPGV